MKENEGPKISPYSGTMKASADEALEQTGLADKINCHEPWNAYAAVQTLAYGQSIGDSEFEQLYGITKDEAQRLSDIMYPST